MKKRIPMRATIRMDIRGSDLGIAMASCFRDFDRPLVLERLMAQWPKDKHPLVSLCVRSGLDLFLQAISLPRGSEILVSAITHPDMISIIYAHGVCPLPIDVDTASLAPKLDKIREAIGPKTKAVMVAHLCGSRLALDEMVVLCRENHLYLIEDCAQAYDGAYLGHPETDISLFSFGPLKNFTALGGALACLRDEKILARMNTIQAGYPIQSNGSYARRVLKYGLLHFITSSRSACGATLALIQRFGLDPNQVTRSWTKGYPGPFDMARFRQQPATALLAVLGRSLRHADLKRIAARKRAGEWLTEQIPAVKRIGSESLNHTFWIFPVLVKNPQKAIESLRGCGFQAFAGLSNLTVLEGPMDRPAFVPQEAKKFLSQAILVPFYPELTSQELVSLAGIISRQL